VLNERYEIRGLLGEGGMAIVFLAVDRRTDTEVALKLMTIRCERQNLARFAREFRTASRLDHPNCIKVYDFAESSFGPFFTMEVFSGAAITTLEGKPLPILLEALFQTASALEYVHAQGLVHRDVKPGNVLVRLPLSSGGAAQSVELKLTDFGLARLQERPSPISGQGQFLGTIRYCAPEQIQLGVVDRRADLYALGEVAFEVLTGRHPFEAAAREGVESLMRAKLNGPPAADGLEEAGLPPEACAAVLSLLAREPADRPETAMPFKDAVGRLLGRGEQPRLSGKPLVPFAGRSPFVGRSREIDVSRGLLRAATSPHGVSRAEWEMQPVPSILFVTGEPGIGKTELQREVARLAQGEGAGIYEGRCFEGNLAPYQPFVDVLRQLLLEQRGPGRSIASHSHIGDNVSEPSRPGSPRPPRGFDPADAPTIIRPRDFSGDACDTLLGEYAAELLRVAPDLRRWLPGEAFRQADLNRELHYVLRAVASFFVELSTFRSTCLFFEDIQWADQSTVSLLQHLGSELLRARELSIDSNLSWPRLFVCCTARHGYGDTSRLITRLAAEGLARHLEVGAFSREELRALVAAVLGSAPESIQEALLEPLAQRCNGNPLFVQEIIRTWRTLGVLRRVDGAWHMGRLEHDHANWPETVREVLRARLAPLSTDARVVVGTSAVVGAVVDMDVLRSACTEMADDRFLSAVEELVAGRILLESGGRANLEFSHDLVRELAYSELSAIRRHLLHGRVGEILEARQARGINCTPEVLARHFGDAGVRDKARRYLIDAGETALRSYAVEHAIQHLLAARDLCTDLTDSQLAARVTGLLASAFSAAGQPLRAIGLYEELLLSATHPGVRARVLGRIGDLHFRVGHFDLAVDYLDRALDGMEQGRPRSVPRALAAAIVGFARFMMPDWTGPRRPLAGAEREAAIIARECYTSANYLWAQRHVAHCAYTTARQGTLARSIGAPTHLADAHARHAIFFGFVGLNRLALRAGHRALAYAKRDGNAEIVATAEGHVGVVHYFGALYQDAERMLLRALKVLDQRGDSWVRMFLLHNLRHVYGAIGDAEKEMACARVECEIGDRVDDPEGRCWGAYGMANALARSGRHAEANDQMQRAVSAMSDQMNIIALPAMLHTLGFVRLQSDDRQGARDALERARTIIEGNWAYVDYAIRTYPLLVECTLGPAWHDTRHPPPRVDIDAAWPLSRRALFWGRLFPNYLPHAWRVRGRAAFARGARATAIGCFTRAIDLANARGARFDLARAHLDLAAATAARDGDHAQMGLRILGQIGAVPPRSESWND
jgi:serine/threonine protein kinase/tetratricopeptide (TPR) repeat protein